MAKQEFLWRLIVDVEKVERKTGKPSERLRGLAQTIQGLPDDHGLFRAWRSVQAGG